MASTALDHARSLPIQQVAPRNEREDTIQLGRYLAFLYDYRWLIAGVALALTLLGALHALLGKRVYEANILIQVEDSTKSSAGAPKNIQTDLSTVFDIKTATASEMEILRSRAVVARAVDRTHLHIQVRPRYVPLIGEWLARRSKTLTGPLLPQLEGYVWGAESARVPAFTVPEEFEGTEFILTALGDSRYRLRLDEHGIALEGRTGETLSADTEHGRIALRVDQIHALPGAEFLLVRHNRLETIEGVRKKLKITENRKDSGIIEVALEGDGARSTSGILNEIGREYVRLNVERKSEKAKKSLAFLDRQLPDLKTELDSSEERYKAFRNRHRTFDLGTEARTMLERLVWVQNRMTELQQKRVELLVKFEEQHPALEEVSRQLAVLGRQLGSLETGLKSLPELEQEVVRLQRDVKVNTELYTSLLATAQQLRLVTSSEVGNARMLDVAEAPVRPVRPRPPLVILLSAMTGLLLGVVAAFCKKNLYGRLDAPEEIEQTLGLPVAGVIPYSENQDRLYGQMRREGKMYPVLPCDAPADRSIESLRRLRTSMQFSMHDASNNIIMVTGPTAGVGKSFVTVNFAAVLASFGKRVLVIDADLRAGNLHRYFGVERHLGLSDAVHDPALFDRAVHRHAVRNVDFLATGALPERTGELLADNGLAVLLEQCALCYDVVLIDTAPVLAVSDALEVAPHAGTILNVVRAGLSTVREIEDAVKQLNQAGQTVTGVVFNDLKSRATHYEYGRQADEGRR